MVRMNKIAFFVSALMFMKLFRFVVDIAFIYFIAIYPFYLFLVLLVFLLLLLLLFSFPAW